jgi:hypothetical protein
VFPTRRRFVEDPASHAHRDLVLFPKTSRQALT